jgi:hypothetical protein
MMKAAGSFVQAPQKAYIVSTKALTQLDKWLTAISADTSDKPRRGRSPTTSRRILSMLAIRPSQDR